MASTVGGVELAAAYVTLTVDGSQVGKQVGKQVGEAGRQAGDQFTRDINGRLRDSRGRFVKTGESLGISTGSAAGKQMGSRMSSGILGAVGRIAGPLAAIFATVGIGKFISGTVDEAREAQKVSAITNSIVKSTGGAAKVTAKQVADLSTTLSNKIGVDDEAIQASANLLLTFKNVRNEVGKNNKVFDQAVGLAQDLSKAGFGSAESAAKMLGKALNDPVKGITALGRAGVTFSDAQKKQIKDAVKNNDLLKAQGIILGEVKSQVGGVAEAAATTGEKVGVAFGNFKEKIGTALLPVLDKVGAWFLEKGLPAIERFGGKVYDAFSGLYNLFVKGDFTGAVRDAFGWAEDSSAVDTLFKIRDFSIAAFDRLKILGSYVQDELWPALMDGWKTIQPGLERAKQIIAETFGGESGASLRDFATLIVDKVIPGIATLVNVWLPIAAKQFSIVAAAITGAFGAVSAYLELQVAVARRFFSVIIDGFTAVTGFAADMLEKLSVVPGFGWAKDAAAKLRGVADKAAEVKDAINGIPKNVGVAVNFKVNGAGQVTLANGVKVDVGQFKARATGGPVRKGEPYIVGEKRPELFVPDQPGTIVPRVPDAAPAGMGGFPSAGAIADAVYDALRSARLAVDTRDNALATARYQNTRGQL